jgi:hypothetical protein
MSAVEEKRQAFELARERMNAARPDPVHATQAERALYDERYQADNEAERAYRIAALEFACGGGFAEAAKLIESLVEALKPFAEHPDFQAPDDWAITIVNSYERTPGLTVGDLRRAREALSQAHTEVILDEGK